MIEVTDNYLSPDQHKKLSNFLKTIVTLASESYSTVNTPAQYAAVEAYRGDFSRYRSKTLNILRSVGNYVYNHLKSNKVLKVFK